ncbi:MAG: phage portal protein [Clostridia bacterium]|nr:phage portal protein [Bacilli bacterium]MBR3672796.1 phage portal protein [Clostridia bacterium]
MKLEDFLQTNYNYNPDVKDVLKTYIEQWKSWYAGNVKSFHNYFIYNGKKKVNQKRFTMNMAKEISEDWSDILWSEKCEINMKDENSQEQFEELVNSLDLYSLINQSIEKSGALGTESTVVSVYDLVQNEDGMYLDVSNAKTRVDLVDIDWIYPLSWNNKGITECAFGSVEYSKGQKYVVCSVHKIADDGNYVIYNHLFRDSNGNLTEITEEEGTMSVFDTKSNIPWFAIFKPLLTNNLFSNSPFGIPHYANAIDNLKAVDISFDALKNEIQDGRKRTFVRADMLNYDDGTQKMTFDPNDTTVYQLPSGATKDDLIQSDSDSLRTAQQIETLNTNLNILGNKVGFGENHYHFDGVNLSTATAVVSSNSKLFRRKKKLEIGYESAIFDLVRAICYASSTFGTYNINTEDMVIQFDDSIIEDKEAESNRALREVNAGLMSKIEYREKIFGETPEIAEQEIRKIQEENPSVNDLLGTRNNEE